jgi:hypothetical protein
MTEQRKLGSAYISIEPQIDQEALDAVIAEIKRQVKQAVIEAMNEAADEAGTGQRLLRRRPR